MLRNMRKVEEPNALMSRHTSKGQLVGYVRVSTFDQNDSRRCDELRTDSVFLDRASGQDVNRPQLEAMFDFDRKCETVICHSMDRLGRNLDDLRKMVFGLTARGVHVRVVKESVTFTGRGFADGEHPAQRSGSLCSQLIGRTSGRFHKLNIASRSGQETA